MLFHLLMLRHYFSLFVLIRLDCRSEIIFFFQLRPADKGEKNKRFSEKKFNHSSRINMYLEYESLYNYSESIVAILVLNILYAIAEVVNPLCSKTLSMSPLPCVPSICVCQ